MNRAILSQRISSILDDIHRLNNALYAMNTTDIQRYPDNYETLSTDAALRAEQIACRLRHILYASTNVQKEEYLTSAALMMGIDIQYNDGIMEIMQIVHDHSYIGRTGREFISHGYACESMYSLRFSFIYTEAQQAESRAYAEAAGRESDAWRAYIIASARQRSQHMERIAAIMAQNFKVCQYDSEDNVPYSSNWDLFFWCNDFTMRGLPSGRDYGYFTLSFNSRHNPEQREKIFDRAMHILELFADDENLHVAVQYEAIMDDAKIKQDARMAIPRIAGRNCVYGNMEGRVETNGEILFFRKKRSRKYVYRLTDTEILSISWQLSA